MEQEISDVLANRDFRYYPVLGETPKDLRVGIDGAEVVFPAVRAWGLGKQLPAKEVYARLSRNYGPEGGWNIQVSHVVYADGSSSAYSGRVIGPVEVVRR